MRNLPAVLAQLVHHAPPLLAQTFKPDCCIAATRVAVHVLARLGFLAKPQPVQLMVYTRNLWRRVESNTFEHPFLHGEWSVGVGFGEDKRYKEDPNWKGYNGHLVALCALPLRPWEPREEGPRKLFLVDLSLGQASRPKKGIVLPQGIFIAGNKININKCVLMYRPIDNPKFTEAPDWVDIWKTDPIIKELVKIIK